jgi:hypothetical protein
LKRKCLSPSLKKVSLNFFPYQNVLWKLGNVSRNKASFAKTLGNCGKFCFLVANFLFFIFILTTILPCSLHLWTKVIIIFYEIIFAVIFAYGFLVSTLVLRTPVTRGPREETIQGAKCGCRAEGRRFVEEARCLTPDCHPSVRVFVLFVEKNLTDNRETFFFFSCAAQIWLGECAQKTKHFL